MHTVFMAPTAEVWWTPLRCGAVQITLQKYYCSTLSINYSWAPSAANLQLQSFYYNWEKVGFANISQQFLPEKAAFTEA